MITLENYIGGTLCAPLTDKYLDGFNPATGEVALKIPDSDSADVEKAVAAALGAFEKWSKTPADDRADLLLRLAQLIDNNLDMLARAESDDNGKPVSLAKSVDIPRASRNFRFFAHAATQFASEFHQTDAAALNYTLRHPVGVAGCISPWNLPLYLFTWKIAPALAAGNCVVAKPSEVTPLTAYHLSKLAIEAGFPAGVLNIVHGYGSKAGAALCAHPHVPLISFTGGTQTGKEIARTAAPLFKKLSLELGGKNATVIFADCNYEEMLENALRASFANQGEICLAGSRVLVERPIYERFKNDFVKRAAALKVGDPQLPETQQGALVSQQHMEKVLSYIELAKKEGGKLLCGGERAKVSGRCEKGWFVAPTIFEGLGAECRTNQEEIFGPVVSLIPFDTEEQALQITNSTSYGLSTSVWTQNLSRAHRVAEKIDVGVVWINCWLLRDLRTPFGGTRNSGVGREGGLDALRFFTEPKNVCIKME